MKKRVQQLLYMSVELLWIFFSLIPTLIIILIGLLKLDVPYELMTNVETNKLKLIFIILLVFLLWLFKKYIDTRMKRKNIMSQIGNIEKAPQDREYMVFNFFAIYLLPVLSINLENLIALILVLLLIVIISRKANLYYYNIFLFIFYNYEKVIISNKIYFIISKRGSRPIKDKEYLYLIDEKLKLYIRYFEE